MRRSLALLVLGMVAVSGPPAAAQSLSAFLGDWMTYTEDGVPEAVVRLSSVGGTVEGRITRLVPPPGAAGYGCTGCVGAYADRDIRRIPILRGLTFRRGKLRGGTLVDFETGETYGCRISVARDGSLRVRIYEGIPAVGVTDEWYRIQ